MNQKTWSIVLGLLLANAGTQTALFAAEHPEHPTGGKDRSAAQKSSDQQKEKDAFEMDVKNYIKSEAKKTGGVFTVRDDVQNKDWKLNLVKVHKNKICMLDQGKTCFACADLNEVNGKNKLDLDFYASHAADGTTSVTKVIIHKLNGKPRFTYDSNNNIVPTPEAKPGA